MWAYRDDRRVDTGTKRNGSMKPEFERLSRRGEDRLERRLESEALSRREIGVMEMSWIFYKANLGSSLMVIFRSDQGYIRSAFWPMPA
jgi:hypothetical protein